MWGSYSYSSFIDEEDSTWRKEVCSEVENQNSDLRLCGSASFGSL